MGILVKSFKISGRIVAFYEKVIKVKADVAVVSMKVVRNAGKMHAPNEDAAGI
jgi:hypothetical protein